MTDLNPCTSTEHNWLTAHHHDPDGTPFRHRNPGCPEACAQKAYGPTQPTEGHATEAPREGVWVAYSKLTPDLAPFPTEIDALRYAVANSWGVRFLKFGETLSEGDGQ